MSDEKPPQDVVRALAAWAGPDVPLEQIEAVVARLRARKGVAGVTVVDVQWTGEDPVKRKARRIAGISAAPCVVDEVQHMLETRGYYDADEDPAVECACGTVWPDGVTGKGHNDMRCEGYEV